MPELPEVETVRRTLAAAIIGRRVAAVEIRRPDYVKAYVAKSGASDSSGSRAATPRDLLRGARIDRLERRGKQLAIIGDDGRAICVHLGMSGQLLLVDDERLKTLTHAHIVWRLDGTPRWMVMRDPRRFGGVWTYPDFDTLRRERWSALGPDALTVSAKALRAGLARTHRAVKSALLDQRVVAGVGNIYCDEALAQAGVHPQAAADELAPDRVERLAAAIRQTLRRSIKAGGSTLRDYRDANGRAGDYQSKRLVYGRAGEPCPTCRRPLKSGMVSQRTTVWCEQCQTR